MARKAKKFDIAEHLNATDDIRDFLNEVAATGDESDFIHASLYKSLSENGNPGFITISKVTKALGCRLNEA